MKFNLKTALFHSLFLIVGWVLFTSCKNDKNINQEKSQSPKIEKSNSFVSKMNEPWESLLSSRHQYYDFFLNPHCYQMNDLEKTNFDTIHIVKIDSKKKLKDFFSVSKNLENLEALMIVYTDMNSEDFEKLIDELENKKHLKKLILNHCNLSGIPKSINKLQQLVTLDLSFHEFQSVPQEITELENLTYLRISKNKSFKALPDNIGNLKKLEILEVAGTSISHFPKSIGECNNLINITANAARIKEIPKEIAGCKELKNINLGYNKIQTVPKEIGKLKNLNRLYLGSNSISYLPTEFKELTKLELCGLPLNKFSSFPKEVLNLTQLYTLTMYGNDFNRIPLELTNLKKLKLLYVDINEIKKSDIEVIEEGLPNLKIKGPKNKK